MPQALIDTIGQTRKFVVKVSKHNLEGKTQALTVTKVLPLEVPVLEEMRMWLRNLLMEGMMLRV